MTVKHFRIDASAEYDLACVKSGRMRSRRVVIGAALAILLVAAGAGAAYLLSAHRAPAGFALGTPAASAGGALTGTWKVGTGSEVGYRAREQFINQPAPTEAVARTSNVTGQMQVKVAGGSYVATSIDFVADLASLVSQDKYAQFQTYQRDFFVRSIYLQTTTYPHAEFRADSASIAIDKAPGPVTVDVAGRLTVHGVTRPVTTQVQAQQSGDSIEVAGKISVDMRDFKIDPPDISFTKAEPEVVIEYHLLLARTISPR